jgi:glycosyltransferase involved in cell wall biosynthesis
VLGKFAFYKPTASVKSTEEPVSVIMAARNESANLQNNLRLLLEQDYPNYEVIVVNDCSWDDSQKVLEEMQEHYKHLHVSQLFEQEKYPTGKKFALAIGIKAAKHDILLFTDADCRPSGNQWLRLMQSRFTPGKEIVLGYSPYVTYPGLLNLYIRFETLMTAMLYFSFALMREPFMGVGRNLAYRRQVFFRHKGFASHQHIMSGDDDLFVNQAATPDNVAIEIDPASFVASEPKKDFEQYARQKSRHLTTGKLYKPVHKRWLGWFYGSLFVFYISLVTLPGVDSHAWPLAVVAYVVRMLVMMLICYLSAKKLRTTGIIIALPLLDLLYVLYLAVFGTKGLFTRNRREW